MLNIEEQEVILLTWTENVCPTLLEKVKRLSHDSEKIKGNAVLCKRYP